MQSFVAPELDAGEDAPDQMRDVGEDGLPVDAAPDRLDREAFWVVFSTAFNLPGMMMPLFAPVGIQDGEEPQARAASDAIYALLEIYYPRALLPGGDTLGHLLTAGPFVVGKVLVVRAIMREQAARRAEEARRVDPHRAPDRRAEGQDGPQGAEMQAANDDAAPTAAQGGTSPLAWMDGVAA